MIGVCCRDQNRIGHLEDLPPVNDGVGFTPCGDGVRAAQHDATEPEFGHRKLRNDFGFWKFGYV